MVPKNKKRDLNFPFKFKEGKRKGFTLIEVVIGIALVGIALLGLAQLFTYSVMNNSRSERMSVATYLAQQQIDALRSLTADELNTLSAGAMDEQIDINNDGSYDFRRITQVQNTGTNWAVRVMVFSAEEMNESLNTLIQNPAQYRVRADVNTVITR